MIQGKIEEKTQKSGETNNKKWTLTKYKINTKWYGTFDKKINKFNVGDVVKWHSTFEEKFSKFNVGDVVDFDSVKKGNNNNITNMVITDKKISNSSAPQPRTDAGEGSTVDVQVADRIEHCIMMDRERFLKLAELVKSRPDWKNIIIKV